MYTVYGIKNCDTVKKALKFFKEKNIDIEFVDFKKTPIEKKWISRWEKSFGDLPVNTKGRTYRQMKDEFESLSKAKKVDLIIENTSMIKRPIVEKDESVLLFGFNESEYQEALS